MNKKLKTTAIIAAILVGMSSTQSAVFAATTNCQSGMTGAGTKTDPCVITNVTQLQAMNKGLTLSYVLGNDIDASSTKTWNNGAGFAPIANFSGTLDGQGHDITGLTIKRPTTNKVGLFSLLKNATIQHLNLDAAAVQGRTYTGALVGEGNASTISDVHVSGVVKGETATGGVAGIVQNVTIDESSSDAAVSSSLTLAGGLVARVMNDNKVISNSHATGDVQALAFAGGLLGDVSNSYSGTTKAYVKNSYATGNVKATGSYQGVPNYYVGGLAGLAENTVMTDVAAAGEVSGSSFAGGLVAFLKGSTVDKAFSSGSVTVAGNLAGGFVANSAGNNKISNSGSTGNVVATGTNSYWVGGFAGRSITGTVISNSYATGNVTADAYDVGGFTGYTLGTKITDSTASGIVTSKSTKNIGKFMGSANGNVSVENSTAKGTSTAGNKFVGAIVGANNVIKNSF